MNVIMLLVLLALVGLLAWAIVTMIPMPVQIRKIIVVVAVIVCVLIVLTSFGLMPTGIPRVR